MLSVYTRHSEKCPRRTTGRCPMVGSGIASYSLVQISRAHVNRGHISCECFVKQVEKFLPEIIRIWYFCSLNLPGRSLLHLA